MPVTAIFSFRALAGGDLPRSFNALFHPLFLQRLEITSPLLAGLLHDMKAPPPYSLSPVWRQQSGNRIKAGESCCLRLGILHPYLEETFLEGLESGIWNDPLRLGNLDFIMEDINWGAQEGNCWSGRESYKKLLEAGAPPKGKIHLSIESPLAFKKGDLHYPLPEPQLIINSLRRRWNHYSGMHIPDDALADCSGVSFASLKLSTQKYALREGGSINGSMGKLTFIFRGDKETVALWHTLLGFAFYSGIGVKTTQGMGMCRILSDRSERSWKRT